MARSSSLARAGVCGSLDGPSNMHLKMDGWKTIRLPSGRLGRLSGAMFVSLRCGLVELVANSSPEFLRILLDLFTILNHHESSIDDVGSFDSLMV